MSSSNPRAAFRVAAILAVSVFTVAAWARVATAEERRCAELGSSCDCSETLNTQTPHFTVTTGGGAPFYANPTDSVGDLQCGDADGHFFQGNHDPRQFMVPEPAQAMPNDSSVTTVWRWTTRGVDLGNGRRDKVEPGTQRLCQRIYTRFSPDFSLWPECNNKIMEIAWHNGGQLQSSTSVGGSRIMLNVSSLFPSGDAGNHIPGPDSISPAECVSTWCRVEMCVSGDVVSGKNLTADFFVSTTDGRLQASKTGIALGDAPGGLAHLWPLNLYREPTNGQCNGTRAYSHVMQASWPTDSKQTIGPAYEIESGAPPLQSSPPPQEPPTPPASSPTTESSGLLQVSGSLSANSAVVTATAVSTAGPYQFLIDCGDDGGWDSVINTPDVTVQQSCPIAGGSAQFPVRVWVWDQGTNTTSEMVVTIDTTSGQALGPPGRPVLVR